MKIKIIAITTNIKNIAKNLLYKNSKSSFKFLFTNFYS